MICFVRAQHNAEVESLLLSQSFNANPCHQTFTFTPLSTCRRPSNQGETHLDLTCDPLLHKSNRPPKLEPPLAPLMYFTMTFEISSAGPLQNARTARRFLKSAKLQHMEAGECSSFRATVGRFITLTRLEPQCRWQVKSTSQTIQATER
jgi:hypothetical protein